MSRDCCVALPHDATRVRLQFVIMVFPDHTHYLKKIADIAQNCTKVILMGAMATEVAFKMLTIFFLVLSGNNDSVKISSNSMLYNYSTRNKNERYHVHDSLINMCEKSQGHKIHICISSVLFYQDYFLKMPYE